MSVPIQLNHELPPPPPPPPMGGGMGQFNGPIQLPNHPDKDFGKGHGPPIEQFGAMNLNTQDHFNGRNGANHPNNMSNNGFSPNNNGNNGFSNNTNRNGLPNNINNNGFSNKGQNTAAMQVMNTTYIPTSYHGYTLRKETPAYPGEVPSWLRISTTEIPLPATELIQMIKKQKAKGKGSVWKDYRALKSDNQRAQIDIILAEKRRAETNFNAEWVLVSVDDERGPLTIQGDNQAIRRETKALHIIVKRQSKVNGKTGGKKTSPFTNLSQSVPSNPNARITDLRTHNLQNMGLNGNKQKGSGPNGSQQFSGMSGAHQQSNASQGHHYYVPPGSQPFPGQYGSHQQPNNFSQGQQQFMGPPNPQQPKLNQFPQQGNGMMNQNRPPPPRPQSPPMRFPDEPINMGPMKGNNFKPPPFPNEPIQILGGGKKVGVGRPAFSRSNSPRPRPIQVFSEDEDRDRGRGRGRNPSPRRPSPYKKNGKGHRSDNRRRGSDSYSDSRSPASRNSSRSSVRSLDYSTSPSTPPSSKESFGSRSYKSSKSSKYNRSHKLGSNQRRGSSGHSRDSDWVEVKSGRKGNGGNRKGWRRRNSSSSNESSEGSYKSRRSNSREKELTKDYQRKLHNIRHDEVKKAEHKLRQAKARERGTEGRRISFGKYSGSDSYSDYS